MTQLQTGYRPSVHLPEQRTFGGVTNPLVPNGDWTPYVLDKTEQQNATFNDPEDCTSYAQSNAVSIKANFLFQDKTIWSERALAVMSGTTQQGNDPWTVAQTIKKMGLVSLDKWPITPDLVTWADYYQQLPPEIITLAKAFVAHYDYEPYWVNANPTDMMAALQESPLTVAGYAWEMGPNGLYITPPGSQPCHNFVLLKANERVSWVIEDSYENDIKELAWDYQFSDVIGHTLTTNVDLTPVQQSAWQEFIQLLHQILGV